ncbi:Glutamyl-tRNA(Gln) amidotransferase subunit A [Pseudovibrio axinellae]|uniref:Glutamyl-tRNA(Gln) amidotransferase subunit A n=1 Tax=Pseudovibrio axinellae TaxID=989403 RepID=A0A165T0B8_9HYPH|nr:amidase family protein [Pseudovibrio axinellae]KZL05119.1 Glutamyl-tRNA(Gln) amidotransferase subunit A [Pseudovibrio axinellae]SER48912.1 aspartyl-tRNA(Asn)/glutamyl-tRNA(Gln) amidotransferase subunit A [Pseudovibrio axinellae]
MSSFSRSPQRKRIFFLAEDKARRCVDLVMDLPDGIAESIFVEFDAARIARQARMADEAAKAFHRDLPLHGLTVSIKDLIDEKGIVTSAGSAFLRSRAPACEDAKIVSQLRAAGAVPFGRTNMSEMGCSGLGLNPHYGTPPNTSDPLRLPGGSSCGAAVSVGLGLCDAGLGTDAGGSVRIPAALNGLYGFKPTRASVSGKGLFVVCPSFDSVGPIARSIDMCSRLHAVLSGQCPAPRKIDTLDGLYVGLVAATMTEGLDRQVGLDFDRALQAIRDAGAIIAPVSEPALTHTAPFLGAIYSYEIMALLGGYLEGLKETGDPYVVERILMAADVGCKEVEEARSHRVKAIRAFKGIASKFDILIAPTVPIIAPLFEDVGTNVAKLGFLLSQNTRAVNWIDGCAATIPMNPIGKPGTGLMLIGGAGTDWHVLEMASLIDKVISPARLRG